jgi:AcrR family transcriptional regulator
LLDAGLQLFGTIGYAGSTIEGLCAEASLNARYFYEQFRSREELLSAVYARHVWSVLESVRRALEAADDPAVRLEAGLRAFVATMLADEHGARIVYLEIVGVSAAREAERARVRANYIDMIAGESVHQARMSGRSAEERRAIAVALVGATDGLVIHWLSGERGRSRSAIVDTLLTVFGPTLG